MMNVGTQNVIFKSIILFKSANIQNIQRNERKTETRNPYHDEKHVVLTAMYFHSLHLRLMDFDQ